MLNAIITPVLHKNQKSIIVISKTLVRRCIREYFHKSKEHSFVTLYISDSIPSISKFY